MTKPTTPLGFTGIFIPRDLWLKEDLSPTEKLLAAVVDALDQGDGCWASNSYLGGVLGLSERSVRDYLAKLEAFGILIRKQDGEKRRIYSVYADAIRKADIPAAPSNERSGAAETRLPEAAESCLGGRRNPATNNKLNKKDDIKPSLGYLVSQVLSRFELSKESKDVLEANLLLYTDHLKTLNRKASINSINAQVEFLRDQTGQWSNMSIAVEIINQTIRQGWTGLFPLSKNAQAPKKILTSKDHDGAF
jgi:biotin operon repressor